MKRSLGFDCKWAVNEPLRRGLFKAAAPVVGEPSIKNELLWLKLMLA